MIHIIISIVTSFILVAVCLAGAIGIRYLWTWFRNAGPARRSQGIGYSIFGPLVKVKREGQGISLKVAAAEIGIAASTLSRIEKGLTVQIETLERVAVWIEEDVVVKWRDAALWFAKVEGRAIQIEGESDIRITDGSIPAGITVKNSDGGSHTEGGGKLADEEPTPLAISLAEARVSPETIAAVDAAIEDVIHTDAGEGVQEPIENQDQGDQDANISPETADTESTEENTALAPGEIDEGNLSPQGLIFALTDKELSFTKEQIIEDHVGPAAYAIDQWKGVRDRAASGDE